MDQDMFQCENLQEGQARDEESFLCDSCQLSYGISELFLMADQKLICSRCCQENNPTFNFKGANK